MKTNRDQLNDALHSLRDDTVSEVVAAMEAPAVSKTVRPRRWMVATAACLCGLLVLGAVAALPMLHAEPPTVPPATDPLPPKAESAYYNAPIVRLDQLSATETATISDPNIPTEAISVQLDKIDRGRYSLHIMHFDCLPGESITIRSTHDSLGYIGIPYNDYADMEVFNILYTASIYVIHRPEPDSFYLYNPEATYTYCTDQLIVDPTNACVAVKLKLTDPESDLADDILLYTITNEEGQVTGVGGMYVGRKYLLSKENRDKLRSSASITRACSLGSVRFENPAAVTDEQVDQLLDSFAARAEELKDTLNFEPTTREEKGTSTIALTMLELANEGTTIWNYTTSCCTADDYFFMWFRTGSPNDSKTRAYIVLKDWTRVEIVTDQAVNCNRTMCHEDPSCPNTALLGKHHEPDYGCNLTTLDGRIYHLEEYKGDGEGIVHSAILIYDPSA